jgi:hypothetical protein
MLKLVYGYMGHILLWTFVLRALFASLTPAWFSQSPTQKILWLGLLALPSLVISYFTLGMLSQLSAVFVVLLLFAHSYWAWPQTYFYVVHWWMVIIFIMAALFLYASALGFLRVDIYAWGYGGRWLAVAAAILALLLWPGAQQVSWALAFALLAFALGIGASRNLWDDLIDPILFFTVIYFFIRRVWGG